MKINAFGRIGTSQGRIQSPGRRPIAKPREKGYAHGLYDSTGFSRFWWLIFPLFWMVFALAWGWSRHARANRALDILKSYADQGKDPPPELLKSLQGGSWDGGCGPGLWLALFAPNA